MDRIKVEINIFGYFFILFGMYGILIGVKYGLLKSIFTYQMDPIYNLGILLTAAITIAVFLLHIYIGINILKLKKIALKILLPLCIIFIAFNGLTTFYVISRFIAYWRTASVGPLMQSIIYLFIYSLSFYYFTRPETKARFK